MSARRLALFTACALTAAVAATGARSQPQPPAPAQSPDAARCAALAANPALEDVPGAPTRITAARLVVVPAANPQAPGGSPAAVLAASPIKQYCQVQGYVAPQNKFELRLPLPAQWNRKFLLTPCAGFCGVLSGDACTPALARGYASATGNGGHDGSFGFDGVWAANSPTLQEDFAWRHNHVITLAAKAITTAYYAQPIVH